MSKSGNPLFRDLYASLELFTQFSASGEQVHPFQRAKEIEAAQPFHWVLAPLLQRDHPEDERRLQLMYRIIGSYADEYLARLSAEYPDAPVPLAGAYHWDATRGRGFLYGEVAHDLTAKLSAGLWEDGAFLPDAAELAAQYGVSLYTVRRALSLLEGRGMVRGLRSPFPKSPGTRAASPIRRRGGTPWPTSRPVISWFSFCPPPRRWLLTVCPYPIGTAFPASSLNRARLSCPLCWNV